MKKKITKSQGEERETGFDYLVFMKWTKVHENFLTFIRGQDNSKNQNPEYLYL